MKRIGLIVLLLALAGGLGYWLTRPKIIHVRVAPLSTGLVEATVANTRAGTLKACRRAKLSPPVGGQVAALAVREGDKVTAGALLLELWTQDLQAQRDLAQGQLASSTAKVEETCLQAEVARRESDRLQPLERRGLVSLERLDQADTEARAKAAACTAARAARQVSEAQIEVAEAALARTRLRAPFAGTVAEVNGEVGEVVTASPPGIITPPAIDLIDYTCVYVSAPIDEVDAPSVQVGQVARIGLDAFPKQRFAGRVRRIAPYVLEQEKQARTVEVEAEFTNPEDLRQLLPGYSADVEVILQQQTQVLRVPTAAILDGDKVLLIGSEGRLVERAFQRGLGNWDWVEVRSGLSAGEQVVLSLERPGVVAGALVAVEP